MIVDGLRSDVHRRPRALGLGAALFLVACSSRTPVLDAVLDAHAGLGSGVYEEMGRWERVLGRAETVLQTDGGETFFYWPADGVAAFTHPHYEGQHRSRRRHELRVTSVIVPLQESIQLHFLPIAEDEVIRFNRLLDLEGPAFSVLRSGVSPGPAGSVDLVASPTRRTVERLHFVDGEPVAVEVRDSWWWSHYD